MRGTLFARIVLIDVLTVILITRVSAQPQLHGFQCLESFTRNQSRHFEQCRRKPCFIFLEEAPYTKVDSKNETREGNQLFVCGRTGAAMRHASGSAFSIIKQTSAFDALCVWGGPQCSFNEMVRFIDAAATEAPGYAFGAMGVLFEEPQRLSENLAQSVSLLQEELSIFGPHADERPVFPFQRLVRPFRPLTWFVFGLFFFAIGLGAWLTACAFDDDAWSPNRVFHLFMGADEPVISSVSLPTLDDRVTRSQSECRRILENRITDHISSYKVSRIMIRLSLTSMVVIFLLFYELSVVNFLFIETKALNVQDVRSLSASELTAYAVEEDTAAEDVWGQAVYAEGKYNHSRPPWKRCYNLGKCFDWALDPESEVKFVVAFRTSGVFQIRSRGVCNIMTIHEMLNKYAFGAGWLYGKYVNKSFRRTVDKEIMDLHETGVLPATIEDVGRLNVGSCAHLIHDIDVGVIGASVAILVMPPLLVVQCLMLYYILTIRRRLRQTQSEASSCSNRGSLDNFIRNQQLEDVR